MRKKPLLQGSLSDNEAYFKKKNFSSNKPENDTQYTSDIQNTGKKGGTSRIISHTEHITAQINELSDMYRHGLLSENEFNRAKAKLLKEL